MFGLTLLILVTVAWLRRRHGHSLGAAFWVMGMIVCLPLWIFHHLTLPLLSEPLPHWWLAQLLAIGYLPSLYGIIYVARASDEQVNFFAPRLGVMLVSLGIMLIGAELALRITNSDDVKQESSVNFFNITPQNRADIPPDTPFADQVMVGAVYSADGRDYFAQDPYIWYHQNARGYRDTEFNTERLPTPSLRLALVGDSLGEGYGVRYPDMAAVLLEGLLTESAGCPVEIYNFSNAGNDTLQERTIIETEVFNYQPDMVILWFYPNDIGHRVSGFLGDTKVEYQITLTPERRRSAMARFIGRHLDSVLMANRLVQQMLAIYQPSTSAWQLLEDNLMGIHQSSQSANVPLVVFLHPVLYHQHANYPFATIHQQVQDTLEAQNIPVFDLTLALKGYADQELWVNRLDLHPNEVGHRLAAHALTPLLPACR